MAKSNTPATIDPEGNEDTPKGSAVTLVNEPGNDLVLPGGVVVKVKKSITRPQLKLEKDNDTRVYAVALLSEIVKGEAREGSDMPAPWTCIVRNLENDGVYDMVLNEVLASGIKRNFANNDYVGLSIAFQRYKVPGKRYYGVNIALLERDKEKPYFQQEAETPSE